MGLRSTLRTLDMGRRFYLLWFGESIAVAGAAMVQFALGVWVYQHTGSVVDFAGVILSAIWPPILILPLAGGLADRVDRRYLILGADLFLALLTLVLAVLFSMEKLEPSHLYVFNSLAGIAVALRLPAYKAAVSTLLDKERYVRASGLMGLGSTVSAVAAPPMAGYLMGGIGLGGLLLIELACFLLGMMLVFKALFGASTLASPGPAMRSSLLHAALGGLSQGLAFFRAQRLMGGLLAYAMVQTSLMALASVMIVPLVLASHGSQHLGFVYTCAALGGLAGALVQIGLRNPRRLMLVVICADALLSACIVGVSMGDSVTRYCVLAFVAMAAAGMSEGCINALWMRKVPAQHRGSVFAMDGMLSQITLTVTVMGGGFVIDHALQPSLVHGGFLAQYVGEWFDSGKRGPVALLFFGSGMLGMLICMVSWAHKRLRRIDLLIPDHDADHVAVPDSRRESAPAVRQPVDQT